VYFIALWIFPCAGARRPAQKTQFLAASKLPVASPVSRIAVGSLQDAPRLQHASAFSHPQIRSVSARRQRIGTNVVLDDVIVETARFLERVPPHS